MRKIVIVSMACLFAMGTVFAQEQGGDGKKREKKDLSEILPKAGDFAIGLDMANLIQSINNSITNPNSANPVVAFQSDFFGKYFLADRHALRARLGIVVHSFTTREFVRDDAANLLNPLGSNPITEAKTVDVFKCRNATVELGIGYEYRRSLWRVQGYAGGEVFGGVISHRDIFEYGNPMTATNQTPTTTAWGAFGVDPDPNGWPNLNPLNTGSYRALQSSQLGFSTGAAVFIGADLFLCRNLSIGAEFNFEARYQHFIEHTIKTETWLFDQAYTAAEKVLPANSTFQLNPGGRLNLMVYF